VRVSYIGYPDTTGLPTIDYRITEAWLDPFESSQGGIAAPAVACSPESQAGTPVPQETQGAPADACHTERLLRLPRCCWSYAPGEDLPAVGALPAGSTGVFTFGVMNRLVKVTRRMMELWARILSAVPKSRLMVLVAHGVDAEASVRERFLAAGITPARLAFVTHRPRREYLDLFNEVDLGLDTFPYAGMTTTCDALWMGVPTVTLTGQTHVSRTGVSLLSAVGLPDLIARTPEAYVSAAATLAADLPKLAALRAGLRERAAGSPLGDGAGLAAAIEVAYREM
jgi:predicted O-linked N-acetylglucosamine transferase (SPINDLY family)